MTVRGEKAFPYQGGLPLKEPPKGDYYFPSSTHLVVKGNNGFDGFSQGVVWANSAGGNRYVAQVPFRLARDKAHRDFGCGQEFTDPGRNARPKSTW